jgi:hypothetical protein
MPSSSSEGVLYLEDVPTVRKLLKVGAVKKAEKVWEGIVPNDELLDRVAF